MVENGVLLDRFAAGVDVDSQRQRAESTVVFAGNLAKYQGIDLLLRALKLVICEVPAARLRIITDSSFAPHEGLAAEVGVSDAVDVLTADLSELPAHLLTSAVAVNPRVAADGTPLKLLNYMAAGRPIVSFAGSGHILEHGVTGWLVQGGDAEGLAAGIVHLLKDRGLAERLGAAARESVAQRYSWENACETLEHVYGTLLTGPRTTSA